MGDTPQSDCPHPTGHVPVDRPGLTLRCSICGAAIDTSVGIACVRCARHIEAGGSTSVMRRKRGVVRDFLAGLGFFMRGVRTVATGPRLWPWAAIPVVINTVLMIGIVVGALYAWRMWGGTWPDSWWLEILYWLGIPVLLAVAIIVIFFLFTIVGSVLAAPFNDVLSEKVEERVLGGRADEPGGFAWFLREMLRAVRAAVALVSIQVATLLILAVFMLIPVVGGIPFLLGSIVFAAMDFLDVIMDRKRLRTREKFAFIWNNLSLCMGFGVAAYVSLLVPGVNLLILPAGAAGATLLFLAVDKNAGRGAVATGESADARP